MTTTDNTPANGREHARSSAEHGHWRKDVKIWSQQHALTLTMVREITDLIEDFEHKAALHERQMLLHDDEIRLHGQSLRDTPHATDRLKGKGVGSGLHASVEEAHDIERESHERLKLLHDCINDAASRLRAHLEKSIAW